MDYVISWTRKENQDNGIHRISGQGTTLMFQEAAENLAKELNRDYPTFDHVATPIIQEQ